MVAESTKSAFHIVDVADEESTRAFFAAAAIHFRGSNVDFILLNAGYEGEAKDTVIPSVSVKAYDAIFGTNVRGIILGVEHGTPLMRKGGTFVFTSSVGSILAFGGNPTYAASKSAVDGLTRCYAANVASSKDERIKSFKIFAVNPAIYETEMSDRFFEDDATRQQVTTMLNPSKRMGTADELAEIFRDLLRGNLSYKSGATIAADGAFPLDDYMARNKEATEVTHTCSRKKATDSTCSNSTLAALLLLTLES